MSITILCIEDESEVREAVVRDLKPFADFFDIEEAEDVADAREVMKEITEAGGLVGLVLCDHVMPGESGVEYLVELNKDPATRGIRKVLLTGQAGQEDTIKAVNEANLDHYITKPWQPENLQEVVVDQLSDFVIAREEDIMPYLKVLDGPRLLNHMSGHDDV
jgi:response regulator RpfG family c-di-GMP phosphodiesterase